MALERYTSFKEASELKGAGVLDLYQEAFAAFNTPREELYVSSPLTSGGARRLFGTEQVASTSVETIVGNTLRLNAQFAELVTSRIDHYFPNQRVTLPHRIGKRPGWGEFDYNRFWLYYLSGIKPETIADFELAPFLANIDVFNNHGAAREERILIYQNLLQSFLSYIAEHDLTLNPVTQMIMLPDHRYSLGCSTELALAEALKIPTSRVMFDRCHPDFEEFAEQAAWLRMAYDYEESPLVEGDGRELVVLKQ